MKHLNLERLVRRIDAGLAWLLDRLVRAYQLTLSPLIGGHCRHHPTCSRYAREALARHGGLHGGGLAIRRVLRCHPFAAGGVDEVPPRRMSEGVR